MNLDHQNNVLETFLHLSQLPYFIALQMMLILCLIMLNIIYMQPGVSVGHNKSALFLPIFLLLIICWFSNGVVPCEWKQLQGCTINACSLETILQQLWSLPFKAFVCVLTQTFNLLFAILSGSKKSPLRLKKKKIHLT